MKSTLEDLFMATAWMKGTIWRNKKRWSNRIRSWICVMNSNCWLTRWAISVKIFHIINWKNNFGHFSHLFCVCAFRSGVFSGGVRNCCRMSKIVRLAPFAACRGTVLVAVGCLKQYIIFTFKNSMIINLRGWGGSSSIKPESHLWHVYCSVIWTLAEHWWQYQDRSRSISSKKWKWSTIFITKGYDQLYFDGDQYNGQQHLQW